MVSSTVRDIKDKTKRERERERIASVCVCVMPVGCLISAAGEVKSGHKSHPQAGLSPLNLHNS